MNVGGRVQMRDERGRVGYKRGGQVSQLTPTPHPSTLRNARPRQLMCACCFREVAEGGAVRTRMTRCPNGYGVYPYPQRV